MKPVKRVPSGVKRTSGGAFDRNDTPLYYIAGDPEKILAAQHRNVLVAVNEVKTTKHRDLLDRLCDERTVLLDSGIFNLTMGHARAHNMTMDDALRLHPSEVDGWPELKDRYYEVATRFHSRLWGVIELDLGGKDVKPETRAMIETDTGITPMPVYHPLNDGWDYYDTLASGYDRICYGNLVKASPPARLRLIHSAAERAKAYPYLWTHLLGVHPNENWLASPMRGSADSSSWLTALRWMPSWKDWSLLRMVAHMPPDLWYSKGTYDAAHTMVAAQAHFTQTTIDAVKGDTHSCLAVQ